MQRKGAHTKIKWQHEHNSIKTVKSFEPPTKLHFDGIKRNCCENGVCLSDMIYFVCSIIGDIKPFLERIEETDSHLK